MVHGVRVINHHNDAFQVFAGCKQGSLCGAGGWEAQGWEGGGGGLIITNSHPQQVNPFQYGASGSHGLHDEVYGRHVMLGPQGESCIT